MSTIERAATVRTAALTERVRRRDVRRFYRAFSASHPSVRSPMTRARRALVWVGLAAGVVGVLTMAGGVAAEVEGGAPDAARQLVGMSVFAGLLLVTVLVFAWWLLRTRTRRGTRERHYRLARFAADNGLVYAPGPYGAAHLGPWAERDLVITRLMRPAAHDAVEFGNFELHTGSHTAQHAQFGGYCMMRLPTALPHIVVRSRQEAARRLASPVLIPDRSQRLSLEGDFDEHFTLYCPEGYERDALYLFTPDVMARLIDRVSGFDVEIIEDYLFLTASRDVVTLDPETWQRIFDAVAALADKVERWQRWRDGRIADEAAPSTAAERLPQRSEPSPAVARQGRRLRFAPSVGMLLLTGVVVAFIAAGLLAGML